MQRSFCFRITCFGLLLLGLCGCVSELALPDIASDRKLVLLGELIADDTISLRLGHSTPVAQGSMALPPDPVGISAFISKENTQIASLQPQIDRHTLYLNTLLISEPQRIFSGSRYSIQVLSNKYPPASATVQIPHPFITAIIDTVTVSYAGHQALRVLFRIYDLAGETNFYSVEAQRQSFALSGSFVYRRDTFDLVQDKPLYDSLRSAGLFPPRFVDTNYATIYERLPLYTNDALSENLKLATPFTSAKRILVADAGFANNRHDLQVFVPKDHFQGSFPRDLGRIILSVKSVTPDYFDYLRAYETFTPATSTGYLAQPVRIKGNVTGGLGVVGGCFRVSYSFHFDSNPF